MRVSGSGKTTVGQVLAQKLGFFDADDLHRQLESRWAPLAPKRRSGGLKWGNYRLGKGAESGSQ
jgi:gluconate kinase